MRKLSFICIMILLMMQSLFAQEVLVGNERMKWWREARFGMFIHWGCYSQWGGTYNGNKIGGGGEWIMNRGKIPVAEYMDAAKKFNPVNFNANAWVKMAKDAGMKYIIITAKHHDGFALFKSKVSTWNIVDATPFGRDVLKELAVACKNNDIKLGFYYSQAQDWVNPGGAVKRKLAKEGWANPDSARIDAYTKEHNGHWDSLQTSKSMADYIDSVAVPQVKELLSNYGDIAVLWWDTPTDMTKIFAEKLHNILMLQPQIITNDRLKGPDFPGDTKTPEQSIPGLNEIDGKDWETCMTMNETWGFKSYDNNWKSPAVLLRNLIDIASKGGNYLLNVGPDACGEFPTESVNSLKIIGEWMKVNNEAIYATKASLLKPLEWGKCTRKDVGENTTLYFSVFNWPSTGKLSVYGITNNVASASLLNGNISVKTEKRKINGMDCLDIYVPDKAPDNMVSVIKVQFNGLLVPKESPENGKIKSGSID
ncbi:MAG: alpha-L-fucosidase [Paludibacter sp.]|nr:alpha-L-fucosidase [Paludibacter sp.]